MTAVDIPDVRAAVPSAPDLVGRARELAPHLLARQSETEERSFCAQDTHDLFVENGFYRMLTPTAFGGSGADLGTYVRVVAALSAGCGSTGWLFNLGASHNTIVCSLFDDDVLGEVFADPNFVCASTTAPTGVARRLGNGDWSISGVFPFASGIPYSTYFLGHAMPVGEEPMPLVFLAPRSAWRRLDDWRGVLGLRGSGSHSVEMVDAVIPARFVVERADIVNAINGGVARVREGDTSHARNGRLLSINVLCAAAVWVGMLQGAVREYATMLHTKTTIMPPITLREENRDYRRWLGVASSRLSMMEASLTASCDQWTAAAENAAVGIEAFSALEDYRLATVGVEIMNGCWEAMQGVIWPTGGTSAAKDGSVMQRTFRDMSMARSHVVSVMAEGFRQELGRNVFASGSPAPDRLSAMY